MEKGELLSPHASAAPRRTGVAGRVYDTGRGYPALLPHHTDRAPGWLVTVRDPVALLARLDRYEGPEYRRVRVAAEDGTACWTYVWAADTGR